MLFLLLACDCRHAAAPPAGPLATDLESFVQRYAQEHPVWATRAGIHSHDAELDDMSAPAIASRIAWLHEVRRGFAGRPVASLGLEDRIDRDVVVGRIDADLIEMEELQSWQTSPLLYMQLAAEAVRPLLARDTAPREVALDAVAARLQQVPRLCADARANLRHPPRVQTEVALHQCVALQDWLQDGVAAAIGPELSPRLATELRSAITSAAGALADFDVWLATDLLPRSDGDFRLGRARFDRKLQCALQTDADAAGIRSQAELEVQRLRRRMYGVALPLWQRSHPGVPAPGPEQEAGIETVVLRVLQRIAEDHPRADELRTACALVVDSLRSFCDRTRLVPLDSTRRLIVEWTPPFATGPRAAALDAAGPLDGAQPARFTIQPVGADWLPEQVESYLHEYNRTMLQVLCMHEAFPGHFVQYCAAQRCPHTVRRLFPDPAFEEGWADYAGELALDAGYGGGDPRLRLEQLKLGLRSALNAVLDVAVHCDGLSQAEALRILQHDGFQEETEARAKWMRVQLSPVSLCAYFEGRRGIEALAEADRARAGAAWSRREFAARLLSHGSPPLRALRDLLAPGEAPRSESDSNPGGGSERD